MICRFGLVLMVMMIAVPSFAGGASHRQAGLWHNKFEDAQAESKRSNRPLLIHFSAVWCGPCRRMEQEVLNTKSLRRQITNRFVAVKVNADHRADLVEKYKVKSLPADIVVDPHGRIIARSQGFQDLKRYTQRLAQVERQFQQAEKLRIAKTTPGPKRPQPERIVPNRTTTRQTPPVVKNHNRMRLGLRGYSPVALVKSRQWVKGHRRFAGEFKGITYFLASPTELALFRSDPDRYTPQLLGCDPVILHETDRAVVGNMFFGAFSDNRLYFFISAENRARFKKSPARYSKTRHVLRSDDIERPLRR